MAWAYNTKAHNQLWGYLAEYPSNYFSTFRRILQTTAWLRVPGGIPTWPGGPTGPGCPAKPGRPVKPTTQRNMDNSTVTMLRLTYTEIVCKYFHLIREY